MSFSDSTQLESHVTAGLTVDIEPPRIIARCDNTGTVALHIGPLLLTFKAVDAATLAASLASAAATAMVNKTYDLLFNDDDTLRAVTE